MTLRELAEKLRELVEKAAQGLSDEDALEGVTLYPAWEANKPMTAGERVRHEGILYRVLQAHTSQAGWEPDKAPSLFAKVLIPSPDVIPEWEQPDSTNPYMKGDKVTHGGKTWVSEIDNNVWEPGVYGWREDN